MKAIGRREFICYVGDARAGVENLSHGESLHCDDKFAPSNAGTEHLIFPQEERVITYELGATRIGVVFL